MKLTDNWCKCKEIDHETEVIYMPDGACSCGIEKHHYHHSNCGKVIQIG